MRVLIAVHGFPPTHSAGAERQAERMAQWLAHNGHFVEIFAIEKLDSPGFRIETSEQEGITIHRAFYNVKEGDNPFRNLYDNPQLGSAIRTVLAQQSFDLMHIISGYLLGGQAVNAGHAMGIPVVVSPMEYWFMCAQLNLIQPTGKLCTGPDSDQKCMRCLMEDKRRYRLSAEAAPAVMDIFWNIAQKLPFTRDLTEAVAQRRVVLHKALDAADVVICNSQFLINKFTEFKFDTSRYVYIRQGLATPTGDKPPRQPRKSVELRLGYIGQIKPHKGVDLLVGAVTDLLESGKGLSLDIWGSETEDVEYVSELKQRSAPYTTIRWNGRYIGSKVWDVLANMDALVIPSRWYENSPNAILEAYEMGLPVVATDLGGMTELVKHETSGLLFKLNDTDDLKQQITRLLHESDLLDKLRAGIPPVKTIDDEMKETVTQYEQLLQGKTVD